jgi:hypothetical protein
MWGAAPFGFKGAVFDFSVFDFCVSLRRKTPIVSKNVDPNQPLLSLSDWLCGPNATPAIHKE